MPWIDQPTSKQGVILSLVLVCFACSGAPERSGRPELPAQSPSLQPESGVANTSVRPTASPRADRTARIREVYGKLPLSFELNRGQTDPQVKFLSRGPGYTLFLTATDAVMSLASPTASGATDGVEAEDPRASARTREAMPASPRTTLRMRVVGANQRAQVSGRDQLPGKVNYFRGNDPTRWQTQIPTYAKVRYEEVYPGIDLVYYGNPRELEYDFIVAPGAEPDAIALTFDGADTLEVDGDGNLILHTVGGQLTQRAPRVYQEIDGVQTNIPGRYALDNARTTESRSFSGVLGPDRHVVRFDIGRYDPRRPLVIDPVLVYSTYLGGASGDIGYGIAVDSAGSAYVTGSTNSSEFPTTPGAFDTTFDGYIDAFVTKLEASGAALVYSTYLGGASGDLGYGIAVDSAGSAYVTGVTDSSDFPTTPGAFDTTFGGGEDAFVTKLDASGAALAYSTYLGGASSSASEGRGIAVDSAGSAYVTGSTNSSEFPTTPGAFDTTRGGFEDAFVTKLEASGAALAYSTYLGGSNPLTAADVGSGIAVDGAGSAYVTGWTKSSDFPTTPGAFDTAHSGGSDPDAFVTKLEASGAALAYSTYLGGAGGDFGEGIAVDSVGSAYVIGVTQSSDFPTTPGAFDTTLGGDFDAFVTKLDASGSALAYSTYLGGASTDAGSGIAVDSAGSAYVMGWTKSDDFPTTPGAFERTYGGNSDAFVTKLEASGAALAYSTYLGGAGNDVGFGGIAVDSAGSAYVTGYTSSSDFPTTPGAFDRTWGGGQDAFVAKFAESTVAEPDLVVTAVTDPTAVLMLKQKFAVTDSTHNQGSASVATTTRYYLSADTVRNKGDKRLSGKRAVPALDFGTTSTGTVDVAVPTTIKLGVYYLLACADDLKVEIESDEGNNCRASTTTVDVRAPDLVETAVSDPPAAAAPGDSFSVTNTVANQGNASAGPTTTRYYLSIDTKKTNIDPRLNGTREVPGLAAGDNSTDTITVTIPTSTASATYYVLACGDDLKKVAESNEKNNCRASATQVTVSP
jgi:hypothetical protein